MKALLFKAFYPCEKIRDFMYDYLEGELPTVVSLRFHTHLTICPECQKYLHLYRTAANAQAFRKENPAPEEFLASTLDFLAKEGIVGEDDVGDAGSGESDPPT